MLIQANARRIPLADGSVQCCVTSPPYWSLRDYGLGPDSLGLELTPELYVAHIVEVFREVWRVLRPDGTCWLNLGDSYAGSGKGRMGDGTCVGGEKQQTNWGSVHGDMLTRYEGNGLKPKDLVGIPWAVAFALRNDGWYLRRDIIWAKGISFCPTYSGSSMPESVRDRPSSSHEYLFLLSKSKHYFYDNEAVKEPSIYPKDNRKARANKEQKRFPTEEIAGVREGSATYPKRNLRSVWAINPTGFKGAHFATFPPALVEPCILAGTAAKGAGPVCGGPWERVVESTGHVNKREAGHCPNNSPTKTDSTGWAPTTQATGRWRPTCDCYDNPDLFDAICNTCGFVVESPYNIRRSTTNETVCELREIDRVASEEKEVLQPTMLREAQQDYTRQDMPSVQEDIQAEVQQAVAMQQALCPQMDSETQRVVQGMVQDNQGVHSGLCAKTSTSAQGGLCNATSARNGRGVGSPPDPIRDSSSPEWNQGRQQAREPSSNEQVQPRCREESSILCDMPSLQTGVPDPWPCPRCGSSDWMTRPITSPSIVLDPFCGSGTTGMVAIKHGREFVGLDLNGEYLHKLATERLSKIQKVLL